MKTKADKMVAVLKAIELFDQAAQSKCYNEDRHWGPAVVAALKDYNAARMNLVKTIRKYIPNDPA